MTRSAVTDARVWTLWRTRLLPLLLWIGVILWVAAQPKTSFFPSDVKTLLGMPREWLQYPYHFGVFFILALLFRRVIAGTFDSLVGYKPAVLSFLGCALVSLCSEALQFYAPTRTPAVRDLALDQFAALSGLILMRFVSDKLFRLG